MLDLSAREARRIALAAQGFGGGPRRLGAAGKRVDARHLRAMVERVGAVQIDSVNVLVRSHKLPMFSRLGPYPRARLMELASRDRVLFEYWGHEASLLPVELQPLLRWRMERALHAAWGGMRRIATEQPAFVEAVYAEVAERGPFAASQLNGGSGNKGSWWGWGDGKRALEYLFWAGRLTSAGRRRSFERIYDLPERVLPRHVLDAPTPSDDDAKKALLLRSARALGVAATAELADYFRLDQKEAARLAAELAEDGALAPARVEGWPGQAWLDPNAAAPRRVNARALLSPLDSLLWHRPRVQRLFGTKVTFEVYTPSPKRIHGYYVLPFLLGDQIAGRVDLKADRKARTLLVQSAWLEPGHAAARVAVALREELALLASWLDLDHLQLTGRGDLAL
ncbi:MAG: winged helix-turn-helix domain-containing protein [Acidimicrobiales bacterium]